MDDSSIIRLFFERSEDAIYELSRKYGRICTNLAMNILRDCRDAEECVNDAYLGVWNTVPPKRPNPLLAYVCRLVRNISLKRYRYNSAGKRGGEYDLCVEELETCVPSGENIEEAMERAELVACIDDFLDTLDRTDRMLFVRRFWYMDSYERLAELSGLREGAVRTRMSRLRSRLREYLTERGMTA